MQTIKYLWSLEFNIGKANLWHWVRCRWCGAHFAIRSRLEAIISLFVRDGAIVARYALRWTRAVAFEMAFFRDCMAVLSQWKLINRDALFSGWRPQWCPFDNGKWRQRRWHFIVSNRTSEKHAKITLYANAHRECRSQMVAHVAHSKRFACSKSRFGLVFGVWYSFRCFVCVFDDSQRRFGCILMFCKQIIRRNHTCCVNGGAMHVATRTHCEFIASH